MTVQCGNSYAVYRFELTMTPAENNFVKGVFNNGKEKGET